MSKGRIVNLVQVYHEDLLPEMQEALASLADIETQYNVERRAVETTTACDERRRVLIEGIEARRQQDREPVVHRLAALHREVRMAAAFGAARLPH